MRCAPFLCAGLMTALLATAAAADEGDDKKPEGDSKAKPSARDEMHRKVLKEFDKDGDGRLNEDERAKARAAHRERMGDRGDRPRPDRGREGRRPDGPGPDGRGPRDRGPEGRPGPGRPGPGGPGGPGGMPNPERLFNAFDADKDGKLSLDEFRKLTEKIRERGPGGPGERRFGPGGPPDGRPAGPPPRRGPEGDRPGPREGRPRDADRPRRERAGSEKQADKAESADHHDDEAKEKAEQDKSTA